MARFNPDRAERLESPERRRLTDPDQVLPPLNLGGRILDLGAGTGFWSRPLAALPEVTEVVAADIEPAMLEHLKERANAAGVLAKIRPALLDGTGPLPFAAESFSAVFVANVLHELPGRPKVWGEMRRLLKPEGRLIIIEWAVKPSPMGPPLEERLAAETLQAEAREVGFQLALAEDVGEYHYLCVFVK